MELIHRKVAAVTLRSVGLDEKWLQKRIEQDPSFLGLGELEIVSREHRQPIGGRIDFLMRDSETYYEVEIMLGALDESHIIRTIEYWDIERQRRPQHDHCAVIVAEQVTSRFFNVLRLLNRAVPMIAVQMSAFRLSDSEIALHAVTVLNVMEEIADEADVDPSERADRAYWEKTSERKSSPEFLPTVDKIVSALRQSGIEPKLTYNRHHIAMGATGYNFCWFAPRKFAVDCSINLRVKGDDRETILTELQAGGIEAAPRRAELVTFSVVAKNLDSVMATLIKALKQAADYSKR
jgi:hypothetical protein